MISSTIALVILFLLMSTGRYLWLHRPAPARLHVPLTGGRLLLRQPRGKCIMLGLAALFPALVLGGVGASAWRAGAGRAGLLATAAATLLPLMASVHQFLSAFLHRIVVNGFGIERIGVLTRRLFRWEDVASIAHNPFHHWFFVTTSHGAHLWLAEDLRGIGDFAAIALQRLPAAAFRGDPAAREELEDLAAYAAAATDLTSGSRSP